MSLEQALTANTEAVLKLAALLEGAKIAAGATAAASSGKEEATTGTRRGRGRPPKEDAAPASSKFTAEMVKAAAVKVKDALGSEAAKKLIADHGAPKLDQLKPEAYEAFINDAEKLLNGGDDEDSGDDDL